MPLATSDKLFSVNFLGLDIPGVMAPSLCDAARMLCQAALGVCCAGFEQHLANLRRKDLLPQLRNDSSICCLGRLFCLELCGFCFCAGSRGVRTRHAYACAPMRMREYPRARGVTARLPSTAASLRGLYGSSNASYLRTVRRWPKPNT
jgi:hypothetical protein